MTDTALVILARAPEIGCVKTRLARSIGDAAALAVYRMMLRRTAEVAARWAGPVILTHKGDPAAFADTGLEHLPRTEQPVGQLGARIGNAIALGMAKARRCVVVGCDCPGLAVDGLSAVVSLLDQRPVAFGPAGDGGFWALATDDVRTAGIVRSSQVVWSTSSTRAFLAKDLIAAGLDCADGPMLHDCDELEDLERAVRHGELTVPGMGDDQAPDRSRDTVLFLCVANSARSQMAEGLARAMAPVGVEIRSAGSSPRRLHPLARAAMQELGIDLAGQRSKGFEAVQFDRIRLAVTLCDEEFCPVSWVPERLHWPIPDPAGGDLEHFRRARDVIEQRLHQEFGWQRLQGRGATGG